MLSAIVQEFRQALRQASFIRRSSNLTLGLRWLAAEGADIFLTISREGENCEYYGPADNELPPYEQTTALPRVAPRRFAQRSRKYIRRAHRLARNYNAEVYLRIVVNGSGQEYYSHQGGTALSQLTNSITPEDLSSKHD